MSANNKPWFLAKEKKERSNFWKSRSSGYSSSNYWLKDSIFEKRDSQLFDKPDSVEKESRYDHFQLAQYQRAISNFVRILTGRSDIIVKYNSGGENYTDGKTITLSPNIKEKEFDTAVGLALHEASHILHSDFNLLHNLIESFRKSNNDDVVGRKKLFLNIVEDLYIDANTYRDAPGYRGYYSSLYQKFFGDKKIEEGLWSKDFAVPTWDNYLFHICNIRNPHRNLQGLPGLLKIFAMLDLPNITRLKKMQDRISLALSIYAECEKYIDAVEELKQQMQKKAQADAQGAGQDGGGTGEIDYDELNKMLEEMNAQMEANGGAGGEGSAGKFTATNGVNIQEEMEGTNYIDMNKLSEKARAALDKMFENQKEFVRGQPRKGKLLKADQLKVDAFASVEIEKKVVGGNNSNPAFGKKGVPLYIIRDLNDRFIESVGSTYGISPVASSYSKSRIEEGINRGKLLAKKLQLRNEEKSLKTSRLDSGKIDKRLLHEIGFDNFDIFSKININAYKPSFIHISLDQSGSMAGSLWFSAMQFAAMFATASKYINNIHLVISMRSTFSSRLGYYGSEQTPYLITIFDSKKHNVNHIRKYFPLFNANNLTPEGLAFDGIMKETLQMARNTDAYFINICDGEPCFEYKGNNTDTTFWYKGTEARKHSNQQMKRMEAGGVKFITYFIGGSHEFNRVKECYGERAVHLKSASDIGIIAKTMNKKLLEV